MINKIIFLTDYPFGERDYQRFGIEVLQKNNFEVEIWDVTPISRAKVFAKIKIVDPINYGKCYEYRDKKEVKSAIFNLDRDKCLFVFLLHYSLSSYWLFRAISKRRLRYSFFMANVLPSANNQIQRQERSFLFYLKKIKKITLTKLIIRAINHIPFNFLGIKAADLVLAGGEESGPAFYRNNPVDKKTKILWIHTLDYDIYLEKKDQPAEFKQKFAVFLDQYFPVDPDYLIFGFP